MEEIRKFPLKTETLNPVYLTLPENAEILSVQIQKGKAFVWILGDYHDSRLRKRKFRIYGTGHPVLKENRRFIATYQLKDGLEVYHLFEIVAG